MAVHGGFSHGHGGHGGVSSFSLPAQHRLRGLGQILGMLIPQVVQGLPASVLPAQQAPLPQRMEFAGVAAHLAAGVAAPGSVAAANPAVAVGVVAGLAAVAGVANAARRMAAPPLPAAALLPLIAAAIVEPALPAAEAGLAVAGGIAVVPAVASLVPADLVAAGHHAAVGRIVAGPAVVVPAAVDVVAGLGRLFVVAAVFPAAAVPVVAGLLAGLALWVVGLLPFLVAHPLVFGAAGQMEFAEQWLMGKVVAAAACRVAAVAGHGVRRFVEQAGWFFGKRRQRLRWRLRRPQGHPHLPHQSGRRRRHPLRPCTRPWRWRHRRNGGRHLAPRRCQ